MFELIILYLYMGAILACGQAEQVMWIYNDVKSISNFADKFFLRLGYILLLWPYMSAITYYEYYQYIKGNESE